MIDRQLSTSLLPGHESGGKYQQFRPRPSAGIQMPNLRGCAQQRAVRAG